jgi:hypothetical protein
LAGGATTTRARGAGEDSSVAAVLQGAAAEGEVREGWLSK